jgi:ankyrin repeat protein
MGASLSREARGVLAAAREGDADAVAAAFAANPRAAERSATFWKRLSALHLAAAQGHSDVIRAVMAPLVAGVRAEVAAGAYPGPATRRLRRGVNSRDLFHRTPLLLAAKRGHLDAARALVESAANVFAQDRDANTSLHYAALHGHGDVVSYLLQRAEARGVLHRLVNRRNVSGFTALHFAVWGRHPDAALALLLAGADPHAANDRVFDAWLPVPIGCTPLHLAVMRQSMDLVWLLLEHYASQEVGRLPGTPAPLDPRLATNLYGLNPAQMAAHIGFRPAVRVLLPHVPVQALFQSRDVEALRVQGARSLKALAGAALARRLGGELDALEAALKRQDEEAAAARAQAAEAAVVVVASSGGGGGKDAVAGSSKKSKAAAGDDDDEGGGDGDGDAAAAINGGAGAGLFGGDSSDVDDEDDEPRDQDAAAAISPGRRLRRRLDQPVPPSCCSRCGRAGGGVVVVASPAASSRPTPSCPSPPPLPPGQHRRSASDGAAFSQQATAPRRLCAECLAAPAGARRRRARLSEPSDGGGADEAAVAAAVAAATAAAPRVGGTLVRSLTPPASLMQMHQHASARLRLARRWPSSQGLGGGGGGGDASDAPAAAASAAAAADPAAPAPAPAAASACCHDSEDDDWDNDNTCGLCLDALARVAAAGCGHASCVPCARRLSEVPGGRVPLCPFCRQAIRSWELRPPPAATDAPAAAQAQAQAAAASVPLPSSRPLPSPPAAAQRARQEEREIEEDDAVAATRLGGQPLAVAVAVAAVAASAALPPLTVA